MKVSESNTNQKVMRLFESKNVEYNSGKDKKSLINGCLEKIRQLREIIDILTLYFIMLKNGQTYFFKVSLAIFQHYEIKG